MEPEQPRSVESRSASRVETAQIESLPSSPSVKRTLSPERYQTGETMHIGKRLQSTGLLTSQPTGAGAAATVSSEAKAAGADSTVDSVAERNLATLLEAAKKRREAERKSSPYATGQQPSSLR